MYKPSIKLELNGSRFQKWNSISLRQSLNALSGITIGLPNPAGLYTNLSIEDMPIKLYLGWDTDDPPLRFDGYHDNPSWSIAKSGMNMSLTGRDFARILFDELTVNSAFDTWGNPLVTGFIIDYIRYINQHLSSPLPEAFEKNNTDDIKEDFAYEFSYEKCLDELQTLCEYGGYEWFAGYDQDNNRKLFIRPPRELVAENVAHAFVVGDSSRYTDIPAQADIHLVEALNVKKDFGFKKNYVKVAGKEVSAVYPLSPPSNPKHLYHENEAIVSTGDALAVARKLWTEKAAPKILVDFSGVGVETLRVGDVVYVNDYRYGASELPSNLFRIIEINDDIDFGSGWKASFKVADFVPSLFQFFKGNIGL